MLVVLKPRALVSKTPCRGPTANAKANETNRPQWSVFSCPFSVLGYMFLPEHTQPEQSSAHVQELVYKHELYSFRSVGQVPNWCECASMPPHSHAV
jgi:hypothetical protein